MAHEDIATIHTLEGLVTRQAVGLDHRAPDYYVRLQRIEMLARHLAEYTRFVSSQRRHPKITYIR